MKKIIIFLFLIIISSFFVSADWVRPQGQVITNLNATGGFVYDFNNSVFGDGFLFNIYRFNLSTLSSSIDLSYKANTSWVGLNFVSFSYLWLNYYSVIDVNNIVSGLNDSIQEVNNILSSHWHSNISYDNTNNNPVIKVCQNVIYDCLSGCDDLC